VLKQCFRATKRTKRQQKNRRQQHTLTRNPRKEERKLKKGDALP
jgi:hypothetical protein